MFLHSVRQKCDDVCSIQWNAHKLLESEIFFCSSYSTHFIMFPAKNFIHWEYHFNVIKISFNSSSVIGHGLHRWPLADAHMKFCTTVLLTIYVVDFFSCFASA